MLPPQARHQLALSTFSFGCCFAVGIETKRRERPLEQRRTSGGKAPKAGPRWPCQIIRFWGIVTSQRRFFRLPPSLPRPPSRQGSDGEIAALPQFVAAAAQNQPIHAYSPP